jgi:hypothetical protein
MRLISCELRKRNAKLFLSLRPSGCPDSSVAPQPGIDPGGPVLISRLRVVFKNRKKIALPWYNHIFDTAPYSTFP